MIALPHALPFIRIGSSSLALCESDWLTATLTKAARDTDVPAWMAQDISRGVESYLIKHFKGTVIDSADLFARIEKTLSSLGLDHVAERIDKTPPPVRISLSELARRAGTGYELAFFHLLEEQLKSAAFGGAKVVECHGLRNGVRRLASTKKWTGRCDLLVSEITDFVERMRERVAMIRPDLTLMIAS
jgi:hypothetical protein